MEKKAAGQNPSLTLPLGVRSASSPPIPAPLPAGQRQRSPGRPSPLRPRRRYLRCCGGSAAPGGPSSFRPGPRAVPPIPQLGTPLGGGAAVGEAGGRAASTCARAAAFRAATLPRELASGHWRSARVRSGLARVGKSEKSS